MSFAWNPSVYRQFEDARSRPFHDLVDRIGATSPRQVVDLGCGPGHLTAELAARWPAADVVGIDNSPEMLADAVPTSDAVRFEIGDVVDWNPSPDLGVAVCNAVLQWVHDPAPVISRWAGALPTGAWLAIQVPLNFEAPSHALMRSVGAAYPAAAQALRDPSMQLGADDYATLLLDAGLVTDVWETTYVHVLTGDDPVLRWVRGTGLRPALAALEPAEAAQFEARYAEELRSAYPQRGDGATLFPFRRLFAVGTRA